MQRIVPRAPRDDAALMRSIKQNMRADLIGNFTDLCDRMGGQIETAADGDQFGAHLMGKLAKPFYINGIAIRVDGCGMGY